MGVAALDADADGDLDLFVSHPRGEINAFYRNDGEFFEDATPTTGLGTPSRFFTGFGLGFVTDFSICMWPTGGSCGPSPTSTPKRRMPSRISLGLGDATSVDESVVQWPDDAKERFGPLDVDRNHELRKGQGEASIH